MTQAGAADELGFAQLALNTSDIAGTLRLYSELFGFINSGAQALWGDVIQIQGLSPEARSLMWWMIGRQPLVQLEIFHHTNPPQQALPSDWRPNDIGWVRFGISVPDFARAITTLESWNIHPIMTVKNTSRGRRAAFRDPFVGVVVEIMEETPQLQGGIRNSVRDCGPALIYVTSCVTDLEAARHFYRDILGLSLLPLEELHAPDDEARWGLGDVERIGFVVRTGDVFLEVIQYMPPALRPSRHRSITAQGIMNIGLAARNATRIQHVIDRLDSEGRGPDTVVSGSGLLSAYVLDAEREIELMSFPEAFDAPLGYEPANPFIGAPALNSNSTFTVHRNRRSRL
jgi:catechol 2,3-dioxygenase-like lactoylglutathione lyase family enzyme